MVSDQVDEGLESVQRLTRDLLDRLHHVKRYRGALSGRQLLHHARGPQAHRSQERALGDSLEPHSVISWLANQSQTLEREIVKALHAYASNHLMGDYLYGIYGVGPVLSAGLLAHLYMGKWCGHADCRGHTARQCQVRQDDPKRKPKLAPHAFIPVWACPTVGHWWAYAGIAGDGQRPWKRGQKRPWNAELKTILWRLSDVLVKFHNNEKCYYGIKYAERKDIEVTKNNNKQFAHIAADRLKRDLEYEKANPGKKAKEKAYHQDGILSPGHLTCVPGAMPSSCFCHTFMANGGRGRPGRRRRCPTRSPLWGMSTSLSHRQGPIKP